MVEGPRSKVAQDQQTNKTYCRICAVWCGIDVTTDGNKIIKVEPDKTSPRDWREFCSKGGNAGNTRDHPKRLKTPMKRVGNKYVPATYEEAIKDIAGRLTKIKEKHGPHAIATYLGNPGGSSMTSSMFQNGFMAGVGSANKYFVGSVDQNNFSVVAEEMYGCELAITNLDIENSRCFLLIGMNPAVSKLGWQNFSVNGWKRVLEAQEKGADLIVVDPRQTLSTKKANTHVVIRPGEDWAFLLGMIKTIFANGWQHQQDCDEANGVEAIKALAEAASLDDLTARCGVTIEQIVDVAGRFATVEGSFCVSQTGVAHNRNGTLGEWLANVLNLICGRMDRKGGRYYQPGTLKNTMKTINRMSPPVERRSRIGGYKAVSGAYPLATLADEIATIGQDQIKALIINGGNPVISGPDGQQLDEALQQLDLLVGIDLFQRESHRHAHWLIPATHFLEREDTLALYSVMYEIPFVQLGRSVIKPLNDIEPDWRFFLNLALAMKVPFMGIRGLNTVIKVSRWVSRITGNETYAFNPRWIWATIVTLFGRVKWSTISNNPQGVVIGEKEYGHFRPSLQTPDGKIQAAPEEFVRLLNSRLQEAPTTAAPDYPFQLINQRRKSMMNSWLVESNYHRKDFGEFVDINPEDAARKQIEDGQKVVVSSATNQVEAMAQVTDEVPTGIVSMDHGWGSRLFDPQGNEEPEVRGVNRNRLVASDRLDELSGCPNLNGTWVDLQPVASQSA